MAINRIFTGKRQPMVRRVVPMNVKQGNYYQDLIKAVEPDSVFIKEFENDVIEGKTVDVNTYISNKNVDYSNKFTSSGERLSEAVTKILTEGFSGAWDAIKVLFF